MTSPSEPRVNLFDTVKPPKNENLVRYRNPDTFGFCTLSWSEDKTEVKRVDLPVPPEVTSWTQAIRYAAVEGVVLWSKPAEWALPNIRRRLASVRTMAMRDDFFVETKRDWSEGRIYFHITPFEDELWTRQQEVAPIEPA